jgi:heme/copper-type cytochrome/quinol oxidase subunit 4
MTAGLADNGTGDRLMTLFLIGFGLMVDLTLLTLAKAMFRHFDVGSNFGNSLVNK